MNRKILMNFCRDHAGFTFAYFLSISIIGLFYYISTGSRVEILYPALLSFFIYTAFVIYRWLRYYPFNSRIGKCIHDAYNDMSPATCEQKEAGRVIAGIHRHYTETIQDIRAENVKDKRFITQWIHNMKTPVSVIDLVLQRVSSGEAEPAGALSDIRDENERLLNNLEQVLNLIRLEDFGRDYVPESIDLAAAVRNIINSRKSQFIYNRVFPVLEPVQSPIPVLADAKWNEAMLDQLVSNAIKYSAGGEPGKKVYFTFEKDKDRVRLKIRDEGIGIPAFDMKRVFEPFFTGENGRNNRNATGIGLYICAAIAGKLGCSIDLKSEPGVGTEATVTYLSKM